MAGRPQKPVSDLQNRRGGRVERRAFPVEVPREPLKAPRRPPGLGKAGGVAWDTYWTDPVCLTATGADMLCIIEYCRMYDRIAEVERQLDEETEGPFVIEGANGPVLNPLLRALKLFTDRRDRLAEKLGVMALNRQRLGLVATKREIGVADLRQRLDRHEAARVTPENEAIEAEATVNLDELA